MHLDGKSILVTGGTGFLGRRIVTALRSRGAAEVRGLGSQDLDLRDGAATLDYVRRFRPDVVVHAAGLVGGIGANRARPGEFFYDNALMGIQLIETCRVLAIEKTVVIGTICAYPKVAPIPMQERSLWDGYPEETNAPYGLAKKMLLVQTQAYRAQYGMNAIYLMPVNLYGPGDNSDESSSHVIPALIRKCLVARQEDRDHIVVWGTGDASREFLYVEDAAEAVALAAERFDGAEPVNLAGSGEITIRELVTLIAELTGFKGRILWDATQPDGQPRRCLDGGRAKEAFGFAPTTTFRRGLQQTIDWYVSTQPVPV